MTSHWTTNDIPDLVGRTALVTGANSGLGLEVTRVLAANGAKVLMACRNLDKAEQAAASVRADNPRGIVEVRQLDLASIASIDACAESIRASEARLNLLINNAGLMAVDQAKTEDGFEMQFGVNHLGHFILTGALMPLLLATPESRIVSMSSMGHRAGRMKFDDLMYERHGYRRWPAYFQSKLANLLFTAELHRRLGPTSSTVALTAHPGGSRTDLGTEGSGLTNWAMRTAVPLVLQSAHRGALPMVRAATDPEAMGGEFYGPRRVVRGRPVKETPSRRARNADDALRLWELSEEITGRTIETPSG
jgi:protochlorophyllide reductase